MGFYRDIQDKIKKKNKEEKELINFLNKREKLVYLFEKVNKLPVKQVLVETGIKNDRALRTYIWDLRKKKIIFLRQKFGFIEKGNK